jgi:hypothetical protein
MLCQSNNNRDHAVKLSIEDIRRALDTVGNAAGEEAAIVAQFALDLAVTAQFCPDGIEPARARQLLRLRIARHRAAQQMSNVTVH